MSVLLFGASSSVLAGLLVLATTNGSQADVASSPYGFSVTVQPDNEFAGFISCGMSIFTLADEKGLGETPALLITSGGSKSHEVHHDRRR